MDISSLIKAIFDPQLIRSAWVQEIIKPGDVFRLKVIEIKDNQRALVDFGKFRALAEVKFPVKAGADLLVVSHEVSGTVAIFAVQEPQPFSLTVLHNNDGESELLDDDGVGGAGEVRTPPALAHRARPRRAP
mgnify:CR=1 FL=1